MTTCDACLDGKHFRCRGLCACSVCGVRRTERKPTQRSPRAPRPPRVRKPVPRDYAAEWQARKDKAPAPTAAHGPCAGTGWRPTPNGDVTRCFCVTSTMRRRSRAA